MASIAFAKVHLNRLMITFIFGIWASEPLPRPGKTLKRLGLMGLTNDKKHSFLSRNIFHINQKTFIKNFGAYAPKGALFADQVRFEFNCLIQFDFLLNFLNWRS